jgi:hypothetical protein
MYQITVLYAAVVPSQECGELSDDRNVPGGIPAEGKPKRCIQALLCSCEHEKKSPLLPRRVVHRERHRMT